MVNGTQRFAARRYHRTTPASLRIWLEENDGVIEGLTLLRGLGECGEHALESLLDFLEVKRFRLGWELWETLVALDGGDPEPLLLQHFSVGQIDVIRWAVWGSPPSASMSVVRP